MASSWKSEIGLFPTTVVGSLPRPSYVQELLESEEEGRIEAGEARSRMDAAVQSVLVLMEDTGIDIITDGEWRRRSYSDVIAQMVDGFVPGAQVGSRWHIVVEPMRNHRNFIADEARFVKANTDRKVKICLPSPFILGERMWDPEASKAVYPTRRDFVRATVPFLRAELEAVRDTGVDIVQIDEPFLSSFCDPLSKRAFDDPDTDLDFLVECVNDVIQGIEGVTIALHICHFNRGRGGWRNDGGYGPIIPALKALKVDQYTLEFSIPAAGDMDVLKELPEDRDVAIGCVNCRSADIDTPEQIVARVEKAMQFLPKERILLAPDCGFAPGMSMEIPLDEACLKLKNETRAARILRERYG